MRSGVNCIVLGISFIEAGVIDTGIWVTIHRVATMSPMTLPHDCFPGKISKFSNTKLKQNFASTVYTDIVGKCRLCKVI